MARVTKHREIKSCLMDMDGVLVREEHPIPGAGEFIARLRELERPFLVLTNNSIYTRRDLAARLVANGGNRPATVTQLSVAIRVIFMELGGLELPTSWVRSRRSPS